MLSRWGSPDVYDRATSFRAGPALIGVDHLPGRAALIRDLLSRIESASPSVLIGPRRSGKTSILRYLRDHIVDEKIGDVFYRSLEGTALTNRDELGALVELAADATDGRTFDGFLAKAGRPIILLDEIGYLAQAEVDILARLRELGQGRASLLYAGTSTDWLRVLDRARGPGSSFGNDIAVVELGPIAEEDAIDFLVTTAPENVSIERERTARWIVETCGTWPFYLQVMGDAVVRSVRDGNRSALTHRRGVRDLYHAALLVGWGHVLEERWQQLSQTARDALLDVYSGRHDVDYRSLSAVARKHLREAGMYTPGVGWIDDRAFKDWIRMHAAERGETS